MGNITKFFSSILFFAVIFAGLGGQSIAAGSPELISMQEAFAVQSKTMATEPQRQTLIDRYISDLVSLEFNLRSSRRPRGEVNAVRHELRRIKKERYASPVVEADFSVVAVNKPLAPAVKVVAVAKPATPQPLAVKTVPAPVIKEVASPILAPAAPQAIVASLPAKPNAPPPKPQPEHIPKTHGSDVKGLAGAVRFSKNNIYTFKLMETGAVSTLVYWATGRRSTDSYGKIWLLTPENKRILVAKWKKKYFTIPAQGVESYNKLRPINIDVSAAVTVPGIYKVEFEWYDGIDPLVIFRVELTS